MTNKTAVITGAAQGLGLELCRIAAERGYSIIGTYRLDHENARKIEDQFRQKHVLSKFVCKSETIFSDIAGDPLIMAADVVLLINNAGPRFEPKPLHLIRWSEFATIFNESLSDTVAATQALLPILLKKTSSVVNVCSSALDAPPKGFAAYAASKAAVRSFTKSLAVEHQRVRSFSVSPSFMETPMTNSWPPLWKEAIQKKQQFLSPKEASLKIFEIIESELTQGRGEDYLIGG